MDITLIDPTLNVVVVDRMENETYHADQTAISASQLVDYMVSPKYARYQMTRTERPEPSPAMIEGSVYHALLESKVNNTEMQYIAFDGVTNPKTGELFGVNTKAHREAEAEFLAANPGRKSCPR